MDRDHSDGLTCWSLIQGAAAGDQEDRSEFSIRYLPLIRSCLQARWGGSPLRSLVDDAVQEVFLECLREGGMLASAAANPPQKFRAFLLGTTRNIAQRAERRWSHDQGRRAPGSFHPDQQPSGEQAFSRIFDRMWAASMIRRAGALFRSRAEEEGDSARRRVELLRLRFEEGLAIRDVAERWDVDVKRLHWDYRRGRKEYEACLREVVAFHYPNAVDDLDGECERVLDLIR